MCFGNHRVFSSPQRRRSVAPYLLSVFTRVCWYDANVVQVGYPVQVTKGAQPHFVSRQRGRLLMTRLPTAMYSAIAQARLHRNVPLSPETIFVSGRSKKTTKENTQSARQQQ